jgi:uncharacterized membrane protein YfcA
VPAARRSLPVLAAFGVPAGVFAAVFGVGGGVLIVPLLLWAGFGLRSATGTSLAAIGYTAVFGTIAYGALGEVHWAEAATIGLPAAAGTLIGVALQRRVSSRLLVVVFAGVLIAVAVRLLLE